MQLFFLSVLLILCGLDIVNSIGKFCNFDSKYAIVVGYISLVLCSGFCLWWPNGLIFRRPVSPSLVLLLCQLLPQLGKWYFRSDQNECEGCCVPYGTIASNRCIE